MASQKITRVLFQILIICLGVGCTSSANKIAYCPKVGVASDLDRVTKIELAANQSKSNILLSSKIQRLRTTCTASADGITVSIVLKFVFRVPHFVTTNSFESNKCGKFSGSNPRALITMSALISNSESFFI